MVVLKQMKYGNERTFKILSQGTFRGFDYYIFSLGTHPTAYIDIKDIALSEEEQVFFPVHGGITYYRNYLQTPENTLVENSNVIGWDYAHYGDRYGESKDGDTSYSSFNILEDIFEAIKYIINELR